MENLPVAVLFKMEQCHALPLSVDSKFYQQQKKDCGGSDLQHGWKKKIPPCLFTEMLIQLKSEILVEYKSTGEKKFQQV